MVASTTYSLITSVPPLSMLALTCRGGVPLGSCEASSPPTKLTHTMCRAIARTNVCMCHSLLEIPACLTTTLTLLVLAIFLGPTLSLLDVLPRLLAFRQDEYIVFCDAIARFLRR